MIMRFLKKIPAGMMVVPMLLGAIINTFLPEVTNIGSFTTAVFTSAGANTAIGIQLFCLGTTLRVRDMGGVVKRGGVLLISKFVIGAAIGIVVGKVFGPTGVLGLSSLAIISAVTNSNGSIYLALMNSYGDTVDQAAMPLLAINDGPMLTMIAMGIGGLADIPFMALVAAIGPILVGMILGNIDKDLSDFLAPAGTILLPFVGFCLGAGMNLTNIAKAARRAFCWALSPASSAAPSLCCATASSAAVPAMPAGLWQPPQATLWQCPPLSPRRIPLGRSGRMWPPLRWRRLPS